MRKSDVTTSYHRGSQGLPMVNVKVHRGLLDLTYDETCQLALEFPDVLSTNPYADLERAAEGAEWVFDAACESGWENLRNDAADLFGDGVEVYAEGRSGGWAVVRGLPDVESWDAIALGRWARFVKWAEAGVQYVPYEMAWLLCANVLQPEHDEAMAEAAEDAAAALPITVTV